MTSGQAQGTQPLVAIHDSELTRALESMPATAPTPTGPGTTGFQWWTTDWHYFVMPDSLKEALRSDGTAFTVIGDTNITAGLLSSNGAPLFPIVVSLASEAIRDDEIAPLTNYVAAGGFLVVGGSSFTRQPGGASRLDFALADAMGIHMVNSALTNWAYNATLTRQSSHRLVRDIPGGQLTWRMPARAEEISWGVSPSHQFLAAHDIWRVQSSSATVIAQGDQNPYLLVKPFGKGYFIYDAAFQPLIGHGGFAPGMYAYMVFRRAIEWAFEAAKIPVPKLSPWPYPYDAACMVRHDLENFPNEIADVEASAAFEQTNGVKGDYYFCTGTLRQDMAGSYDTNGVVASLRRAVANYGATVGPHNGGLKNPDNSALVETNYDFWHWGTDEALDVTPPGYANGKAYALTSLSNSFADIESWLPGLMTNGMRTWVAPNFNATREDSYDIQAQLGVKIAGDQKLTPFPHWTVSTRTPDKRYSTLSEPVSDWFVNGLVAQSLEPWHPPGVHNSGTMHDAVDFYYDLGALINLYSHTLSTGEGDAGQLVPDYITYCMNTNLHPRLWAANAVDVYNWWTRRASAQVGINYALNGDRSIATFKLAGAADPNIAVELLIPPIGSLQELQVFANGVAANSNTYRLNGRLVKMLAGSSVTNAQIAYRLSPAAADDFYSFPIGTSSSIGAPGVLANDLPGTGSGSLAAALVSGPRHGVLTLRADGSFTYIPTNNFTGDDAFLYRAMNGTNASVPATAKLLVKAPGVLFSDDFSSLTDPGTLAPWTVQRGTWTVTTGQLQGQSAANNYGNVYYQDATWTDYKVEARVQFSSINGLGAGIGGRLQPATGAHYAAWIYPEGSPAGSAVLRLVKFESWANWSGTPMQAVNLPGVGTNWHSVAMTFQGTNIQVSFDGVNQISVSDNNFDSVAPYQSGGITVDMYTATPPYTFAVDSMVASSLISPPTIVTQPSSRTNTVGTSAEFHVVATGDSLTYQWQFNGAGIAGATASSYIRNNVQMADAGGYNVIVSNPAGSVTSSTATLTVMPSPPTIVMQPASRTNTVGTSAEFHVVATGDSLTYQWQFNGANIGGATASSYARNNVQMADAGGYNVIVSNPAGSVTSSTATLTVAPSPPTIVTQPSSRTNTIGTSAEFHVVATGDSPTYQWQFNGANIGGATASSYMRNNVQMANAGSYRVVVANAAGSVLSSAATLTVVQPAPPSIATQPKSQTVIAGQNPVFSVSASGSLPLAYQWRFNQRNIASATSSSYTVANAQPANAGTYTVVVTNNYGMVTSAPASLTVNYSLTVTASRGGSVLVLPAQTAYSPNSLVTLTAVPALGYLFSRWSGSANGILSPLIVTMTTNKMIKANFTSLLGGPANIQSGAPVIESISQSNGNVIISGSGGLADSNYYVLVSTDLASPRTTWTRIATNAFDAGGGFSFTSSIVPNIPNRFFAIQVP